MANGSVADRVAALVRPTVEQMGLSLWDVKYVKEGASWYLRVYIDKKEGLVDINDCTDVSHALDPVLDEADIIGTSYYFEVWSPGLERELCRPEHFAEMKGKAVRVLLVRAVEGQKEFIGTLMDGENGVTVEIEGEPRHFEKKDVAKIKLYDID